MAFFEELSKKFTDVSRVVTRKAKEMTDVGGLKIQIADEKRKVNKLYENLGRKYFEVYKDEPQEELAELVNQVKAALERVDGLEDEILRVEAESAAKAEEERMLREAEAAAKKESVAETQIREIHEEEADSEEQEETVSGESEAAPEGPADGAEAGSMEAGNEEAADAEEDKTEE